MGYNRLSQIEEEGDVGVHITDVSHPSLRQRIYHHINIVLLVILTNLLTIWAMNHHYKIDRSRCLLSSSPILDHITLPHFSKERESTLLPNASIPSHIFRLPPSPEVDAAWERIAHDGAIVITEEELLRIGKDPEYSVQTHPSWGYPEGSYVAIIDGFHQIHCLNALRKGLIYNYEYYWGAEYGFEPPSMFEVHLNHCIDILLQDLMCYADTSPVTYTWVKDNREPYPDFAVNRQCRDFEALVQWREEHMIPDIQEKGKDYTVPDGALERPPIPGFVEFEKNQITGWKGDKPTGPLRGLPPTCKSTTES